jgi:uncharacterized protein YcfL
MRKNTFILILAFLLFACNSQTEKKTTIIKTVDSSALNLVNKKSEKFIPETKGMEKFDTIIVDRKIQITIKKTDLDSYVIHEYEENGNKQIEKYRDAEISLTIKQNSQILLDTVFSKKQFSKYADKGFMEIAIFHNYWFNKLDKDKIELFGVITEPETDYVMDFYHYFDLTNRKLTFIQKPEEDED